MKIINNLPKTIDYTKEVDKIAALQKYKKENEALYLALERKMKPPFVVGIPHHGHHSWGSVYTPQKWHFSYYRPTDTYICHIALLSLIVFVLWKTLYVI